MNVLFDDGLYLDRRLRYEDKDPNDATDFLGRYDPNSEAYQFFKPIDNIWGDFRKRDEAEEKFAYSVMINDPITKAKKDDLSNKQKNTAEKRKIQFKEKYYMKYADGRIVDIANVSSGVLSKPNVVGIAFTIFREEHFEDVPKAKKAGKTINSQKNSTFYLEKKLVIKADDEKDYDGLAVITSQKLIENNDHKKYPVHDANGVTTYQLGPTLVLNKDTILKSRNYKSNNNIVWSEPSNWNEMGIENPNNWDMNKELIERSGEIAFNPKKYWGFDKQDSRLIIRLGRDANKYILFLHGDKEATCPIRIPTE